VQCPVPGAVLPAVCHLMLCRAITYIGLGSPQRRRYPAPSAPPTGGIAEPGVPQVPQLVVGTPVTSNRALDRTLVMMLI
jgi:hypothetical protein